MRKLEGAFGAAQLLIQAPWLALCVALATFLLFFLALTFGFFLVASVPLRSHFQIRSAALTQFGGLQNKKRRRCNSTHPRLCDVMAPGSKFFMLQRWCSFLAIQAFQRDIRSCHLLTISNSFGCFYC